MDTLNSRDNQRVIKGKGTADADWQASAALSWLPFISSSELAGSCKRAVIVAPHPDDELLGCGGLIQLLAKQDIELLLLAITDGEASHRGSSIWSPEILKQERPRETIYALRTLCLPDISILRLYFPDGDVAAMEAHLILALQRMLRENDVVFTTWRFDGHPDHEATGRACAIAAATQGAKLIEVPIWCWHWAKPDDPQIPWKNARKLALDPGILASKRSAIACYRSQLEPDASTGHAPILTNNTLARLLRPYEVYFL